MIVNDAKCFAALVKVAKYLSSMLLILVVGYFYFVELSKNNVDLNKLFVSLNYYLLALSLLLCIFSYLAEIVIWNILINENGEKTGVTIIDSIAVVGASGLFKYIPGKIWTFAAQWLWFRKYGVPKTYIIYINMIFVYEALVLSLYMGLAYAFIAINYYAGIVATLLVLLLVVNILLNLYGHLFANCIFSLVEKILKIEFPPVMISQKKIWVVQIIFTGSWILAGFSVYALASGFGLALSLLDAIPVVVSMWLSWLAGSLAVMVPAGFGVREGAMLLILKPVLAVQTALLLPILTRILLLFSEAILGLVALYLGTRKKVFMFGKIPAD